MHPEMNNDNLGWSQFNILYLRKICHHWQNLETRPSGKDYHA